jgi:hypothetical protein
MLPHHTVAQTGSVQMESGGSSPRGVAVFKPSMVVAEVIWRLSQVVVIR